MRQVAMLIYVGILAAGIYYAYQWNSARLPARITLEAFTLGEVQKVVIERGQVVITLIADADDEERWLFSSNLDAVRSYGVEKALVQGVIASLHAAKYAYLVESTANTSVQRYGLGQQEQYKVQLFANNLPKPITFVLGSLAINGYDVYVLEEDVVYRAPFLGLYERMAALGRVVDAALNLEDRLFA
jgi:hypothetical protein